MSWKERYINKIPKGWESNNSLFYLAIILFIGWFQWTDFFFSLRQITQITIFMKKKIHNPISKKLYLTCKLQQIIFIFWFSLWSWLDPIKVGTLKLTIVYFCNMILIQEVHDPVKFKPILVSLSTIFNHIHYSNF